MIWSWEFEKHCEDKVSMNDGTDQNVEPLVVPVAQVVEVQSTPATLWYATAGNIQPPDSRIVCELLQDGVRLIEPAYFSRGWRLGVVSFILLASGIGFVAGGLTDHSSVIFVGIIFLLFGVVMTGESLRRGNRPLVIEANRQLLAMLQPSLLTRRIVWPRDSIKGIVVSNLSTSVTGRPMSRVLLTKRFELPTTILGGRPRGECLWAANVLRQAMGFDQP
jgi:hypothetical protein